MYRVTFSFNSSTIHSAIAKEISYSNYGLIRDLLLQEKSNLSVSKN